MKIAQPIHEATDCKEKRSHWFSIARKSLVSAVLFSACLLSHGAEPLTPVEHRRAPEQTFLTFPEWYLVHSPAEYATYLQDAEHPSRFPLFAHIGQLWQAYSAVTNETRAFPFNAGYHLMISVIGASTSFWSASNSASASGAMRGAVSLMAVPPFCGGP